MGPRLSSLLLSRAMPCCAVLWCVPAFVVLPRAVGTFRVTGGPAKSLVQWALQAGYSHFGRLPQCPTPPSLARNKISAMGARPQCPSVRLAALWLEAGATSPWPPATAPALLSFRRSIEKQEQTGLLCVGLPRLSLLPPLRLFFLPPDTASIYKNETEIGNALRASGVPRESVFITTKLSPYEHGWAPGVPYKSITPLSLLPWECWPMKPCECPSAPGLLRPSKARVHSVPWPWVLARPCRGVPGTREP